MGKIVQFTVSLANRPRVLSELASALWEKGVNIQAFGAEISNGHARANLIVDKPAVARRVLWSLNCQTSSKLPKRAGSEPLTRRQRASARLAFAGGSGLHVP